MIHFDATRPQDVPRNPAAADEYVRDFSEDMPRHKVMTARSVMKAGAGESINGLKRVPVDTRLDALIPLTATSDQPLAVVDADGRPLGTIDRTAVMLALGKFDVGAGFEAGMSIVFLAVIADRVTQAGPSSASGRWA